MPEVQERVSKLEETLERFIVNVENSHLRIEADLKKLHEEIEEFKNATLRFQAESEKDRKALHEEMTAFKNEMSAFKDEMAVFKDEMAVFKDEMAIFKNEMAAFKDEMTAFKDEMAAFKDEMAVFKDKVDKFIERQEEENRRKNREWSNLAKKMGTIVEDLIAPALRPVLSKYFDCEVSMEGQRILRRKQGESFEIDAIVVCEQKVFMVEARSTPRFDDIEEIKEKSEKFFEFFPEYKGKELIIIFGSITFPENVIYQASRNGIYVLAWREWEYMDILNFNDVKR